MESAANKKKLQNIFRYYFSRHPQIKLSLREIKAAESIMNCRSLAQGFNLLRCPHDHEERIQTHSCRHRSCPICAERDRFRWIEKEKERLLNCAHYHVIFTLPHEYLNLWQYNRKWFTRHLFKAARDTLMELMADPKYHGVKPGILMTLHSWGRQLNYHPHLHCLVTAGGMDSKEEWKALEGDFLLAIRVVKALYRGKLQAWIRQGLRSSGLKLPPGQTLDQYQAIHRELYQKAWSVRIQEQYEHGRGVVLYLARYLKGGPIKPSQIFCEGEQIKFSYLDHRDKRQKTRSIDLDTFIRRILWHVPENGVHVVRHYGIYASKYKAWRDQHRGSEKQEKTVVCSLHDAVQWCCETCGEALQISFSTYRARNDENSIIKSLRQQIVQQEVQDGRLREEARHRWRIYAPNC